MATGGSAGGHQPVMAREVASWLITRPGDYVDATIGGGGHAEVMLTQLNGKGRVLGLDRDADAVATAKSRLARFGDRALVLCADYRQLADVLEAAGIEHIAGALFDFGLSTLQLDNSQRGFSYRFDGPLDLRFDQTRGQTAAQWLKRAPLIKIEHAFREYGDERHAFRLAQLIVAERRTQPVETTGQLVALIRRVAGAHGIAFGRSAARVFQALRIVVNDELAAIPIGLNAAIDRLVPGGRVLTLAYHSKEDRIAKHLFRSHSDGRPVQKRIVRPAADEISRNPRAKAARLRIFERHTAGEVRR